MKQTILFLFVALWGGLAYGGAGNNHAALFLGATSVESKSYPTVGIDYEFKLNSMFGVGAFGEVLDKEKYNATIWGLAGMFHFGKGSKIVLGAGVESANGHSENLFRIGYAYDFHLDSLSISPVLNIDSVDGHTAYVYGVAVGFGF